MRELELAIFAGTTEGRQLSEVLARAQIKHTICVATEYGETVLKPHPFVKVHQGRMNQEEIERFLLNGQFAAVIDTTHPFAKEITKNIHAALHAMKKKGLSIPCLRLKRDEIPESDYPITYFQTEEACANALQNTQGNILLTTGSKELSKFCISQELKKRLYVRVLPSVESISNCMKLGICGKQIIAMQGPFTTKMNEAMLCQYEISCLVTKESGASGGYPEKLEAAKRTETQIFVIGRQEENRGDSFQELCKKIEKLSGKTCPLLPLEADKPMEITLAGIGMGHRHSMTKEVERAIDQADLLLGSGRILKNLWVKAEKRPFYQAEQIIPYLQSLQNSYNVRKVVILFSGDSGFYSGCQPLYAELTNEIKTKRLCASVRVLPGISSVAYLAACIGESYQDAAVYSIHGKTLCNLANRIMCSPKTFLLTSGLKDINWLGRVLTDAGMTECEIITGYQLSYQEQKIERHTPLECCALKEEGLYTCLITNPYAVKRKLTHGIIDKEFIRDSVPMTKEEVREVSICKLHLKEHAVVYDIGSGTGSVAVEIAGLSHEIKVYAIEKKPDAISLIEKNKEKFGLENITIVSAEAPEKLSELPMATHAFIGGSGGRLKEILETLRQINPNMRIVIHAVSMETICELKELLSVQEQIKDNTIVQIQVSRAKKVGNYHLIQSENPVWICAFSFYE